VRIAIDATSVPRQRAGAGTYIHNLVQALARVDRDNTYFVFAKPETFDRRSLQRLSLIHISEPTRPY